MQVAVKTISFEKYQHEVISRTYRLLYLGYSVSFSQLVCAELEVNLILDDQVFKSLLLIINYLNDLTIQLKLDYFFLSILQKS